MPPTLPQQLAPASWKELIDNGNLVLATGRLAVGENENETALDVNQDPGNTHQQPPAHWPPSPPGYSPTIDGSDLLPVYCGLLGCLIIGLVAWILVKQMLRRSSSGQHDEKSAGPSLEPVLQQQQQQQQQSQAQRRDQQQPVMFQFPLTAGGSGSRRPPKRRSADSGFGGSEPTEDDLLLADGVLGRRMLRDLSESRLQRLENILANDADPDGWKQLANELGFNADELTALERQSVGGGNQLAIREMLHTWSQRPTASIAHLIGCLRRAGRADALILFRESPLAAPGKSSRRRHRNDRPHQHRQRDATEQQRQDPENEDGLNNPMDHHVEQLDRIGESSRQQNEERNPDEQQAAEQEKPPVEEQSLSSAILLLNDESNT